MARGTDYSALDEVTDAEHLFAHRGTPGHTHAIKWIHSVDAMPPSSMRIEVVLSSSHEASPTSDLTQLTAVQPFPECRVVPPSYIVPSPHGVVMVKPVASHGKPEGRTRRLGRLSRQFMAKYLYRPPEISEDEASQPPAYTLLCPMCCGGGHWFLFSAPPTRPPAQLFLC